MTQVLIGSSLSGPRAIQRATPRHEKPGRSVSDRLHKLLTPTESWGVAMTVMIPPYFGMAQEVMACGLWKEMKPSERSLYAYLMYQSERRSTLAFTAKDCDIALSGVKSRSLCNARKKLQERGLIRYSAGRGNIYTYTICDVETRLPYPGDQKVRVMYQPKRPEPGAKAQGAACGPSKPVIRPVDNEPSGAKAPLSSYGLPGVFSRAAGSAEQEE